MIFKASWDTLTKIINAAVTILYLGIAGNVFFFSDEFGPVSSPVIGIILFLSYFGVFAFMPVHYRVTPEALIIQRPFDKISIEKSDIASVALLSDDQLKWSIRVFGSGGMFGFFGRFYNSKIGRMTWYATRRRGAVLVKTVLGKNIILTPDDREGFVNQFGAH